MARQGGIRWHKASDSWLAAVGEFRTDRSGRLRRRDQILRYQDGRKIPKSDRKSALEVLASALGGIESRARVAATAGLSIMVAADAWLNHINKEVERGRTAERTRKGHSEMIGWFLGFQNYSERSISSFESVDLDRLVNNWRDNQHSPNYCNRLISTVGTFFSWAARRIGDRQDSGGAPLPDQLIKTNPFSGYPRERVGVSLERYAPVEETAAFLDWLLRFFRFDSLPTGEPWGQLRPRQIFNRSFLLLFQLVLWTGCRPGEACAARWPDLDFSKSTITLQSHKTARKIGKARVIYVPDFLLPPLRRLNEYKVRDSDPIFTHSKGQWNTMALCQRIRLLRNRAIKAGVPLSSEGHNRWHLYRLRHTRASDGLMRGVSPSLVAAALGTSPEMINRVYGHLLDDSVKAAAATMAK